MSPKHPPLTYVFADVMYDNSDPTGYVDLIAFVAPPSLAGRVLSVTEADRAGIDLTAQVGALCWHFASGVGDVVYVPPRWRRQGVATSLLYRARGIAWDAGMPRVEIPGTRTALGQAWAESLREPIAPLQTLSEPTTPPEDIEGITDERLLIPDHSARLREQIEQAAPGVSPDVVCGPAAGVRVSAWKPPLP